MTGMLYRTARTSQKIAASTPLESRTFWKAARHSQTALKTMRGDMESALQHNFQGPVQVLQVLTKFKLSTGFGGKCSKGSLGSRAEVSSSSFSCPSEKLWDVEISCILMYYIYTVYARTSRGESFRGVVNINHSHGTAPVHMTSHMTDL